MSRSDSTPDEKLPKYTPRKLRLLRNWDLGLSQEELAEKMQCDSRTIQRYEKGDSPIPPEFIRKFEKLRTEERQRRARELGEEEFDLLSFLIPGLELVQLVPIRKVAGKLLQMFVAVPKEWLPQGSAGEPPSPLLTPEPGSGAAPSERGSGPAIRKDLRKFAVVMAVSQGLLVCLCVAILGVALMLYRDSQIGGRWGRGLRVAREAKFERPAASPAGAHEQKAPEATADEQEPEPIPENLWTDGTSGESGGTAAGSRAKRSILMPHTPYSWQKLPPCDVKSGEVEKEGGCYFGPAGSPPCPSYAVESESRCFVPAPRPKRPNTVESKK